MKRKSNTFSAFLCFFLCLSLLIASIKGSGVLALGVTNTVSFFADFKNDVESSNRELNSTAKTEDKTVFSPSGFGGGGYNTTLLSDTPEDIVRLMKNAESMYENFKKSGKITEQFFGATSQTQTYGTVKLNNKAGEDIDIKSLLNTTPGYLPVEKEKPYILIYHTHTTEGYELLDKGWYSDDYNSRTKDTSRNMVRVGDAIAEQLEKAGFGVIHDTAVYDASYNGAYDRSRVAVEKYLKEYPSIAITLDVHRDAIHYEDGTKCKPVTEINGKKAAQVMIISGCEGEGVENFPDWKTNLSFAVKLQAAVEENFEGLMRPIFFCHRKYNMDLTPSSVLLEFGTDANTLEEAVYSGTLIGKSLGDMLNKTL